MKWGYYWSYKPNDTDIDECLGRYGQEGWELCGVDDSKLFFKRPIEE